MLFIQPQFAPSFPVLNSAFEDYLDQLQYEKERAYLQQQLQQQLIKKANAPAISKLEDETHYFIKLSKQVNFGNHHIMNKFTNNYQLKLTGNSFIVKSTKDNFYKEFLLPRDADLHADITYKLSNQGFSMLITIPKKMTVPVLRYMIEPTLSNISCNKRLLHSNSIQKPARRTSPSLSTTPPKLDVFNNQNVPIRIVPATFFNQPNLEEQNSSHSQSSGVSTDNTESQTKKTLEDSTVASNKPNSEANSMRNYETSTRKTSFAPNESNFKNVPDSYELSTNLNLSTTDSDSDSDDNHSETSVTITSEAEENHVPVRRVRSPTVEDVVDEEFI